MAKYWCNNFNDVLKKYNLESKEHKYTTEAWAAKCMLAEVNEGNVAVRDGYLIIKRFATVINYPYTDSEIEKVAKEIADEIKKIFGVSSNVKYKLESTEEIEPDPIPPLYWGGTDTHYRYSLTIKIKLPE